MLTQYSVAAHWQGGMDDAGLQKWASALRARLAAPQVSLGLVFLTPQFFPYAAEILEILRVHGQIPLLVGCSSTSLVANEHEFEEGAGLVLALYHLPGAELRAVRFTQEQLEASDDSGYWPRVTGVAKENTNGWLVFADPFHLDAESWLKDWNTAYAPLPIVGGLASGHFQDRTTQIYWNDEIFEDGGVAISVGGKVRLASVISQGCTPIGETWTITKVDRNFIHKIGNRPAYEVLVETFNSAPLEQQAQMRGNLFVGLVINEYLEEFHRGDFLIRNLLGADPVSGSLAIGAIPRLGQTLQFQRRDASAATEDMIALLARAQKDLTGHQIFGGVLCCCNGRGTGLFGHADHDARLVQKHLGPLGISGFFCNGEIGPVGVRNFLHGYTASLAIFVANQ